jgi:hypothetical protein
MSKKPNTYSELASTSDNTSEITPRIEIKILASATHDMPIAQKPTPLLFSCARHKAVNATAEPMDIREVTTSSVRLSNSSIFLPWQ